MTFKNPFPPKAFSWAFYDFANTIFSAIVVTVYLPLYMANLTGKNTPLGVAATLSMILSGLVIPSLGALTDRTGKTKLYLFMSTALCVVTTSIISFTHSSAIILILFMAANFLYHASLVFYNSLLPLVAPPEKQGLVSGLGTGLGYLGVLFALPIAHQVDTCYERRWVFLLAGIMFFIFSLPLFIQVPERRVSHPMGNSLRKSLSLLLENKSFLYLLLGNFFLLDVLNAFILWISVLLVKSFSLSQSALIQTILALNASAFLFGILLGKWTDQIGYKKILLVSMAALAAVILVAGLKFPVYWVRFSIILFGGMSAAGIWTAGRKGVAAMAPEERIGEFFGLYGFTTKVSAIGSTAIPLLADHFGFQTAVLSQLASLVCAYLFIRKIPDSENQ